MKRRQHMTETFESSVHDDTTHKFQLDRTLYKGIKDNDVSKIIDVTKESGAIEERLLYNEGQELAAIVADMRKKYDEVKTETKRLQSQVQKNKRQLQLLKQEQERLRHHITSAKTNLEERQRAEGDMVNLVQSRIYDLDIYKEMQNRLKHDILIMRKRNYDKDIFLKKDNIKLKTLKHDQFNKTKISYRCRDMLESIERTVVNKQQERVGKINSLYEVLNKKHDNIRKREDREREIEEVMMKAMSEKLQEEKECINICLSNLFLKKFLKNKMERLISENEVVESAYHKIRSSTDVRDSNDLIHRFLNREKDYGVLLQTIAERENFLENLKAEREVLEAENNSLTQISDELHENAVHKGGNFAVLEKVLEGLQEKLKDIKYKQNMMKRWTYRFHCAYSSANKEQLVQKYQNNFSKALLEQVLRDISKYTDHLMGDENSANSINTTFLQTRPTLKVFSEEMVVRNNRVKTAAVEEPVDIDDGIYDGASEADYLNYNRRATKKNEQNRRFRIKTQAK